MNSSQAKHSHQTTNTTQPSALQPTPTLGTSFNLFRSLQEPSVQVEAVVEIQIGNLLGAATIDLTEANATSTSPRPRGPFTFLPSIFANNSYQVGPTCYTDCNGTGLISHTKNSTSLTSNITNWLSASRTFPSPTSLEVFTGDGVVFTSINWTIWLLTVLNVVVVCLM
jgi:hypothetical protein